MNKLQSRRLRTLPVFGALTLLLVFAAVGSAFAFTDTQVSGRVVNAAGQPVVGIQAIPYILNTNTGAWTDNSAGTMGITDANGNYTVTFHNSYVPGASTTECTIRFNDARQLLPRKDVYRATWFGNKDGTHTSIMSWIDQATSVATHFTVTSGVPQTGRDALMKHHYARIAGKVTNRAGKPIPNVVITAYGKYLASEPTVNNGNGTEAMTAADGTYELYVYPHLQDGTWWAVTASGVRNSQAYHGRWYSNILNVLSIADATEATQANVTHFTLNSEEQATNVNFSLTENRPDVLTFSYAKPKKKGSKTLIASGYLNPLHDPKIKITAKVYKYSSSKKKYLYKYTVPVTQKASGLKTKWSISKNVGSKGKYKVTVSVSKHLWWLHRSTSASKKVTIK